MDPCPGHKRAHASLARPELDFFDAYVAKGGVPAEFFYLPARHRGATDTLASPALPCAAPKRSATHAPSGAFRQSAASPPRRHLPTRLVRPPPPAASLPLAPVSPDSPSAFPAVLHHPFAQPSAASSLNHPPTLTLSHISLNRTPQPGRAWVALGLCGKLETSAPRFPHAPAFSSCKAARRG